MLGSEWKMIFWNSVVGHWSGLFLTGLKSAMTSEGDVV